MVATLLSAASLITGVTFGLFTASTKARAAALVAGTVSFGAPVSTVCNIGTGVGQTAGPLFPSNASTGWSTPAGTDPPCTLRVTYAGNPAYLALDVLIAARAGTLPTWVPAGTTASTLYDGTANGLQLQITDSQNGPAAYYVSGTKYTAQGSTPPPATSIPSVTCPAGYASYTCYQVIDLLVGTAAVLNGGVDTFAVNYQLPATSTSGYQNGTALVVLTVHAVQTVHNPLPTGVNQCSAAARCLTGFNWS